jgi:hypothetical protein
VRSGQAAGDAGGISALSRIVIVRASVYEHSQVKMLSFKRYARRIRERLRSKRFACRRVASSSGVLSAIFGSADLGWECTRGHIRVFVGRERDYWIARVDIDDGDQIDLIEKLGIAIEDGNDRRRVDEAGLEAILAWMLTKL